MRCSFCKDKGFIINNGKALKCECMSFFLSNNPGIEKIRSRFNPESLNKELMMNVEEYIKSFSKSSESLYLTGLNSSGKTTLAIYILGEVSKRGFIVQFLTFSELVRMSQELDHAPLQVYKDCELLLIDDAFDTDKSWLAKTGWQIPLIDDFMRNRLELKGLPTIITSNKKINEIGETYTNNLLHLVDRNCKMMELDKCLRQPDKHFENF